MSTHQLIVLVTLMLAVAFLEPVFGRAYSSDFSEARNKRLALSVRQKYCGNNLSSALQLVCDGKYNPLFKQTEQSDQGMSDYPYSYEYAYPLKPRRSAYTMLERLGERYRRQSGGVYDECCLKGCTQHELNTYCAR